MRKVDIRMRLYGSHSAAELIEDCKREIELLMVEIVGEGRYKLQEPVAANYANGMPVKVAYLLVGEDMIYFSEDEPYDDMEVSNLERLTRLSVESLYKVLEYVEARRRNKNK